MRNDALYRGRRKFDLYVPQRKPTQDDRQDHRSHAGYGRGYVDAGPADPSMLKRMTDSDYDSQKFYFTDENE